MRNFSTINPAIRLPFHKKSWGCVNPPPLHGRELMCHYPKISLHGDQTTLKPSSRFILGLVPLGDFLHPVGHFTKWAICTSYHAIIPQCRDASPSIGHCISSLITALWNQASIRQCSIASRSPGFSDESASSRLYGGMTHEACMSPRHCWQPHTLLRLTIWHPTDTSLIIHSHRTGTADLLTGIQLALYRPVTQMSWHST